MSFPASQTYRFDEFELNASKRLLLRNQTPITLSPKAFEVLTYLVANSGRVLPKEEILKAVWPESFVEESNLAQQISLLRKALTDRAGYIATIPGRGYQFTGTVRSESAAAHIQENIAGQILVQTVRERTHLVLEESYAPSHAKRDPLPVAKFSLWAFGSLTVAACIGAGWMHYSHPTITEPKQIVLADFANTTGDATFDRTLRRALEVNLEQSPYMDVMSERTGVSTLRMMGRDSETPLTANVAKEVCERTNRKILITGALSAVGPEYLITLEATDCSTGKTLAGAKSEAADKTKVLAALDAATEQLRSKLGESAKSLASYQVPMKEATTPSLDALKAYSMGKYLGAQGKPDPEVKPFFEKAIELDPQFAMAYGELATIYYNNSEMGLAKKYMTMAYEASGHVTAKEKFLIQAHYYDQGQGDMLRANDAYRVWGETYPDDWVPWIDIANNDIQLGLYQQAIPAGEQALKLGPDFGINYSVLMRAYDRAGRLADAERVGEAALRLKKDYNGVHETLYDVAYADHNPAGLARMDAWIENHPDDWYCLDRKAQGVAAAGRYKEAAELFRQAYDIAKREKLDDTAYAILIDQAQVEAWLGLTAETRATLARLGPYTDGDGRELILIRTQLGDKTAARRFVAAHKDDADTLMKFIAVPQIRAVVASQEGKPLEALTAIEPARPYEYESYSIPTSLAEVYAQSGQLDNEIAQYKDILAHPGVGPTCAQYPLAHLALARAYAKQTNQAASRQEYEAFLTTFKDADPDLPVLQQAKQELARLH